MSPAREKSTVEKILTDVRVIGVMAATGISGLFGSGWYAYGQVMSAAEKKAEVEVAPVKEEVANLKRDVRELKDIQARINATTDDTQKRAWETQLNVRQLVEQRGMEPMRLVGAPDGGVK